MSAAVKVFGCRPHERVATYCGGRRTKTSKGGNRDGGTHASAALSRPTGTGQLRAISMADDVSTPVGSEFEHNLDGTARILLNGDLSFRAARGFQRVRRGKNITCYSSQVVAPQRSARSDIIAGLQLGAGVLLTTIPASPLHRLTSKLVGSLAGLSTQSCATG